MVGSHVGVWCPYLGAFFDTCAINVHQDPGVVLCKMPHPYADGDGSRSRPMSDPFADGKREIWPEVRSLLGP